MDRRFLHRLNRPNYYMLSFCAGIAGLRFLDALPPPILTTAGALVLLVAAVKFLTLRLVAAFAVGICWANIIATANLRDQLPKFLEKKDVSICGYVLDIPASYENQQRFDFKLQNLNWRGDNYSHPNKIRLRIFSTTPRINSGEQWCFVARLKQARGYQNPGAVFNYETYLFHHRIRATGYVRKEPPPRFIAAGGGAINGFRQRVADFIISANPDNARAGLVAALVVGVRNHISRTDWDILARTGTIHLMAISGLHIGLVAGFFIALGSLVWRFAGDLPLYLPAPKFGIMVGLCAGLVYAILAGMTIPTQRAVCMLTVVVAAMWCARPALRLDTWLLALVAVLIFDPLAVMAHGFYLSFGAVLILLLAVKHARSNYLNAHEDSFYAAASSRIKQYGIVLWWCQVILFIGMAPLLFALFNRISLVAPFANLLAVPLVGLVVVPLGLLGLSLYALGWDSAAAFIFQFATAALDSCWGVLAGAAAPSWSVWLHSPPLWSLPLAAMGVWILISAPAIIARASGLLWLLPLFGVAPNDLTNGEYKYTMLEVGNGLAAVVQTERHWLVYDVGARRDSFDAGKQIVAPHLRHRGVDKIDMLVISHGDNDHAGGYEAVANEFSPAEIISGTPQRVIGSKPCRSGHSWRWDGVLFEILWPQNFARSDNESSCVLRISSPYGALLLSGDIGKPSEAVLTAADENLTADVLQVPHHGSKTSSTEEFLRRVQPQVALASVGYLNGYKHPHKSVVERYARHGIALYLSAEEGAMVVQFLKDGIKLNSQRHRAQKYWMQPAGWLRGQLIFN